MYIDICVVYWD